MKPGTAIGNFISELLLQHHGGSMTSGRGLSKIQMFATRVALPIVEVEEARALLGVESGATELSEAKHVLISIARGERPDTNVVGTPARQTMASAARATSAPAVAGVDLLADVVLPWAVALRVGPTSMSVARAGQMVRLSVEVPQDVQVGRGIRVPGAGGAGSPPVDLFLSVVKIEPQKTWVRDGVTLEPGWR